MMVCLLNTTEPGFESQISEPRFLKDLTMLSWLKHRMRKGHRGLGSAMELRGMDGTEVTEVHPNPSLTS